MHAEGFAAGELKHGPIALIEEGTPVVVSSRRRGAARCCTTRCSATSRRSGPAAPARSSIAEEGDEDVGPLRRRPHPRAAHADPAGAARHHPAAAGLRLRAGAGARPATSTSRATSPSPSPSSEPRMIVGLGVDIVDVGPLRGVAGSARPGLAERLFTAGRARGRTLGAAGRPVRGQGGAGQGARAHRPGSAGRTPRSRRRGRRAAPGCAARSPRPRRAGARRGTSR